MALALLRSVLRALSLTAPCRPRRPDGRKAGRSGEEYGKTEPFCHLERGIFLKDFWNRHQGTIAALLLFAAAALVVIYVIAVFGGAIMRLFGFRYNSVGSIFLFFVLATIVSFPISQFAEALPRVLLFHYGKYLLISASRPGTQAMNLQGIWKSYQSHLSKKLESNHEKDKRKCYRKTES